MGKMANEADLDFFIEFKLNAMFRGLHGTGKTSMMVEAMERNGIPYRYFSAPTMDPWVDFIGVPKVVWDEEKKMELLRLIIPEQFALGTYQCLIFDEINRAKPATRNAIMELTQFKTINGSKFNGIEFIWGAMNPEETEDADLSYDVEVLDPAQKDRFQVFVDVPFEPSKMWFEKHWGNAGIGAVEWWNELDDKVKLNVSPRRLNEALEMFQRGGDLRFTIPEDNINITSLLTRIDTGSLDEKLEILLKQGQEQRERFFHNINNTTDTMNMVLSRRDFTEAFLPYMQKDLIAEKLIEDNGKWMEMIMMYGDGNTIVPIVANIIAAKQAPRPLRGQMKDFAKSRNLDLTSALNFAEAVQQGMESVGKKQNDRFMALHGVIQNFNSEADLDSYANTVELLAKIINVAKEDSLKDIGRPYFQIGTDLVNRMDDSCRRLYGTTVMEIFEGIRDTKLSNLDEGRIKYAREILEHYLVNRPTKK